MERRLLRGEKTESNFCRKMVPSVVFHRSWTEYRRQSIMDFISYKFVDYRYIYYTLR